VTVTPHEELLAGLNPAQREAVLHVDGPLSSSPARARARRASSRIGRPPDPRARREAERDPRDHVHEQGRDRDARAARADPRPHGPRDLDPHLPRRLRRILRREAERLGYRSSFTIYDQADQVRS
jgi:DNA helicase-2/ATP-dependent DNA helicase PcrA